MRLPFPFFSLPFVLLLLFAFHAITAKNLVRETCKKCAQEDPNLNYNFCVTSLQAVPESNSSDLRELGAISIKLIKHNVTNTRKYITKLLQNKKVDQFLKGCLQDCMELYSDAIPTVKQAQKDYKAKRYGDANIELSSVLDASSTCEDGFKESKHVLSPLTKRNNNTFQLSALALSIINMLS